MPGLDGTGVLFSPFIKAAPAWANPIVVAYDKITARDYEELALEVTKRINYEAKYILLGESFSGPVATLAAAKNPRNLAGIVLCASFIANPRPLMSLIAPRSLLAGALKLFKGRRLVRHFMASHDSPKELLNAVMSTIESVPTETLVARLDLVKTVDVSLQLSDLQCPVLYLRAIRDKVIPSSALTYIEHMKPKVAVINILKSA